MSLFGLGTFELLVIAAVILIVFGPKRLPELARLLAQAARMAQDATREIQRQLEMSEWEEKHKKRRSIGSKSSSTAKSTSSGGDSPYGDNSYPEYDASTYADGVYEPANQTKPSTGGEETASTIADASQSGESADTNQPYNPEVKSNGGEAAKEPANQPIDDPDKVNDARRFSREFTD